jgi:hypothetical protein
MDVDVDAPDDIVHVRRYVVLIAANNGALWRPGWPGCLVENCPALARRCVTARDGAEAREPILGVTYRSEEVSHATGDGLFPDPVR